MSEHLAQHDRDDLLLRPPQFTLRALFVAVSLVALLCSLAQWVSPASLLALLLLSAVIVCHVAGNAIGTRLRQLGMERARRHLADAQPPRHLAQPSPPAPDAATPLPTPPNYLSQRRSLGWPLACASGAGLVLGGAGGVLGALEKSSGVWLSEVVLVGAVAFAVLGGLAAFAVTALVQVGISAVRQALAPTATDAGDPPQRRTLPADSPNFPG